MDINKNYLQISKALKQDREKLIAAFDDFPVIEFMRRHSRILDTYFQQSFEESMVGPRLGLNKNPYAIVALGYRTLFLVATGLMVAGAVLFWSCFRAPRGEMAGRFPLEIVE